MADLYRKSSLERISSPEQLDKVLKVTSPMSWLALIGITVIILVTLVWSIVGTIPVTITTQGMISAKVGSNAVYAQESGTVVSVRVRVGDEIHLGDQVLTYKNANKEIVTIYSDQVGTVASLVVANGDTLTPGNEVIRVTPTVTPTVSGSSQMVVCYVPLAQAKKLERGMRVKVSLDSLDGTSYGHMEARIVNIDAYATSVEGMSGVIGGDNNLSATFTQQGAVVAVACELFIDEDPDRDAANGYWWSNEKGTGVTVTNGSLVTAKIVTEEVAPITKLFSKIKDIWGD